MIGQSDRKLSLLSGPETKSESIMLVICVQTDGYFLFLHLTRLNCLRAYQRKLFQSRNSVSLHTGDLRVYISEVCMTCSGIQPGSCVWIPGAFYVLM